MYIYNSNLTPEHTHLILLTETLLFTLLLLPLLLCIMLQVRSHSSVSFVSDASPTAVTGRSIRRSTRPQSRTTARPSAAPSPTPTPAPCANTWKFTSSRRLPLNPRTCTTPSLISSYNVIRLCSSPSTLKWTVSPRRSLTVMLTFPFCPITSWTSAQPAKRTISCCCGVRLRWQCLWISLCQAWRVSWPRSSRVAGPHAGASAQSTQPYLSCLTLKSGMSVPGLQHHICLCFTQTTSNQNLVMMRSMSRRMEGTVETGREEQTSHTVKPRPGQRTVCGIIAAVIFLNQQLCGSTSVAVEDGGGFFCFSFFQTQSQIQNSPEDRRYLWTKSYGSNDARRDKSKTFDINCYASYLISVS